MSQEYTFIKSYQSEITYSPGATLTTLIGNKGGGKNTLSTLCVAIAEQEAPSIPRFANTRIMGAYYIPDMLKWIAMKYVRKDESACENDIDEAAVAGLESRGSFKEARALDSYLFTMSRKVNANIRLLSQLLSMIEKRTQWISDFYILCESHYEGAALPAFFSYIVYDENLQEVSDFEIDGDDARNLLYRRFRTQEVPFQERLNSDFQKWYDITQDDLALYDEVMGIKRRETSREPVAARMWYAKKALRPAVDTVLLTGNRYKVEARDWDADKGEYFYALRELA